MQSRYQEKWCQLDDTSRNLLTGAIRKLGLSARASDRQYRLKIAFLQLAIILKKFFVSLCYCLIPGESSTLKRSPRYLPK